MPFEPTPDAEAAELSPEEKISRLQEIFRGMGEFEIIYVGSDYEAIDYEQWSDESPVKRGIEQCEQLGLHDFFENRSTMNQLRRFKAHARLVVRVKSGEGEIRLNRNGNGAQIDLEVVSFPENEELVNEGFVRGGYFFNVGGETYDPTKLQVAVDDAENEVVVEKGGRSYLVLGLDESRLIVTEVNPSGGITTPIFRPNENDEYELWREHKNYVDRELEVDELADWYVRKRLVEPPQEQPAEAQPEETTAPPVEAPRAPQPVAPKPEIEVTPSGYTFNYEPGPGGEARSVRFEVSDVPYTFHLPGGHTSVRYIRGLVPDEPTGIATAGQRVVRVGWAFSLSPKEHLVRDAYRIANLRQMLENDDNFAHHSAE